MSRDSLQMGEQSWLWHYRENNSGVLSDTFYQRSHGFIGAEGEQFLGQGYGRGTTQPHPAAASSLAKSALG